MGSLAVLLACGNEVDASVFQDVFLLIIGVGSIREHMGSLWKIERHLLEGANVRSRSGSKYELDRLAGFGDNHMNPQSIEIAALTADAPSIIFRTVDTAPADPVVVTDRHREAVHHILLSVIGTLTHIGQQSKQSLPDALINPVKTTVQPAFGEHTLFKNKAHLLKTQPASLLVATKQSRCPQCHRHHFRRAHPALRVIRHAPRSEKISAEAVNCDNLFLHERPRIVRLRIPQLYQRSLMYLKYPTDKHLEQLELVIQVYQRLGGLSR